MQRIAKSSGLTHPAGDNFPQLARLYGRARYVSQLPLDLPQHGQRRGIDPLLHVTQMNYLKTMHDKKRTIVNTT